MRAAVVVLAILPALLLAGCGSPSKNDSPSSGLLGRPGPVLAGVNTTLSLGAAGDFAVDAGLVEFFDRIPACYRTCDVGAVVAEPHDDAAMAAIAARLGQDRARAMQAAADLASSLLSANDTWLAPLTFLRDGGGPKAAAAFVSHIADSLGLGAFAFTGPDGARVAAGDIEVSIGTGSAIDPVGQTPTGPRLGDLEVQAVARGGWMVFVGSIGRGAVADVRIYEAGRLACSAGDVPSQQVAWCRVSSEDVEVRATGQPALRP